MSKYIYRTYFKLEVPVNDIRAARKYLTSEDMVKYFHGSPAPGTSWKDEYDENYWDFVTEINWELSHEDNGYIEVICERELTKEEAKIISEWISGQNSDGLGESFEQQDFATHEYCPLLGEEVNGHSECGMYEECDECDGSPEYEESSFDWRGNDYILEFVEKN